MLGKAIFNNLDTQKWVEIIEQQALKMKQFNNEICFER